ncbi:MAG: DNA replication and repair protein RecF [Bacteroidia bacterium]|nr:DNA replication and repair protein RecF [Bacteroidia bacterium]MDW8158047.1 DNA replication and repair protein RecF [Bacteroidia bacterium]
MYLKKLFLFNFRNYSELCYEPIERINCIVGENGIGKTNILEAIHYLAMTRGFSAEKNALQHQAAFFMIEGIFQDAEGFIIEVQCSYTLNKGKKLFLGKKNLSKMSEHIGKIPIVTVLPDDTELVKEASAFRRKWLDSMISQFDPSYLQALIEYERILAQRNSLLQQNLKEGKIDKELLHSYSAFLVRPALYIVQKRKEFLAKFSEPFSFFYGEIVSRSEKPQILLQTPYSFEDEKGWQQAFAYFYSREMTLGRTLVGVHRDDLLFVLENKPLRHFGSQGQIKTFITALKFAQYHFLVQSTGKFPILLLDDVFDKLDEERIARIIKLFPTYLRGQIFITDTSLQRLSSILINFSSTYFVTISNNQIQPVYA